MDEFIGGFDVLVQVCLFDLLCGLVCELDLVVVIVIYDLVVVCLFVDCLMVMCCLWVVEVGFIDQIFDDLQYLYM